MLEAKANPNFRLDRREWGTVPLDANGNFAASNSSGVREHTLSRSTIWDANHNRLGCSLDRGLPELQPMTPAAKAPA